MTFRHALTQMFEVDPQMWETRFHPNLALCNLEGTKKKRWQNYRYRIKVARIQIWVIDDRGLTKEAMVCPFKECLAPLMSGSQLHGHCWCRLQTLKPHLHCDIWLDLRTCCYHLTIRQERIPVSVSLVWESITKGFNSSTTNCNSAVST